MLNRWYVRGYANWKTNIFDLIAVEYGMFYLSAKLVNHNDGFMWWISYIHGPSMDRGNIEFRTELYDSGKSC